MGASFSTQHARMQQLHQRAEQAYRRQLHQALDRLGAQHGAGNMPVDPRRAREQAEFDAIRKAADVFVEGADGVFVPIEEVGGDQDGD